jgi:transposase
MPVRPFSREQTWLLPPRLDDLLPDDHAARFVAEFVDSLDASKWQKLGIGINGELLGAPEYHPRVLLSIWLYGFMTRTRSSRKLEAACRDQISYLWLTGWQRPDHNTLWRFYKEHRNQMRNLFKHSVQVAVKLNLIDLAVQAVDGTKVVANASKERSYGAQGLKWLLERTEIVIRELEEQNENGNDPPPARLPEKLRQAKQLSTEIKAAMAQLTEEGMKQINLTDVDAKLMKSRQGIVAGYNVQAMVSPATVGDEEKGMLITAVDAVQDAADSDQLVSMLEQAEQTTGKKADMTLADAGYHSGANLADCIQRKQTIAMPDVQERALQRSYHKDKFSYNQDNDTFTCPNGQTLPFVGTKPGRRNTTWRVYRCSGAICHRCAAFGDCTRCRHQGRELQIGPYDVLLRQHREWMATDKAKTSYAHRKELPEPVFGILKEQMGFRRFLLRGWNNVRAETVMMATAFNLRTLYRVWRRSLAKKQETWQSLLRNLDHCILFLMYLGINVEQSFTIVPSN